MLPDILVLQNLLCSLPSLSEVLQEAGHHKIVPITNTETWIQVSIWISDSLVSWKVNFWDVLKSEG